MAPRIGAVRLPGGLCLHMKRKNPAEPEPEFEARLFLAAAASALRRRKFIDYGEERERLFPGMFPTRSHSGILMPAMLSRGPKDYLRQSQRAS